MKKWIGLAIGFMAILMLIACQEQYTRVDSYVYNDLTFPNYSEVNPVRYLNESEMGFYDGWQDFGAQGEIQTVPIPMMSTYTYQMYSWYIRNDLQSLYCEITLPSSIEEFVTWACDIHETGSRILWYSMGHNLPDEVTLVSSSTISSSNSIQSFVKAEFELSVDGTSQQWIVYFMDDGETFNSFAVRVNESIDFVSDFADGIIRSYQIQI